MKLFFVIDHLQGPSSVDAMTLRTSYRAASNSTLILDNRQVSASALPLSLSLRECKDIGKMIEDRLVNLSLPHNSSTGLCSIDATSVLRRGNITM